MKRFGFLTLKMMMRRASALCGTRFFRRARELARRHIPIPKPASV